MSFVIYGWALALPELLLSGSVLFILVLETILPKRTNLYSFSLFVLFSLAVLTLLTLQSDDGVAYGLGGMFIRDTFADAIKLLLYICFAFILIYSQRVLRYTSSFTSEFFILLLLALLGMMVLVSSANFLLIYIGLEIYSLALYALIAFDRENRFAVEAAVKYFLLGAIASGMLLYGISLVYGALGTLDLSMAGVVITSAMQGSSSALLLLGLVFIVSGLAFKLGVVPFHMWVPDVYEGASTPMTLLLASAPKFAVFAMAFRLLVNGLLDVASHWQQMLLLLAVLSMFVGNILAIIQTNIKRMLAYSAIANMGFMLLGLSSGVKAGTSYLVEAYSATLFYTFVYVLGSVATFALLLLLSNSERSADQLDDLKGLSQRDPWLAWMALLVMFSLAGIPPMVGFWAKLGVLESLLRVGNIEVVILAVIASVIGAFYYLRIVKCMFFDEPIDVRPYTIVDLPARFLFSCNALAVVLFGLFGQGILAFTGQIMLNSLF